VTSFNNLITYVTRYQVTNLLQLVDLTVSIRSSVQGRSQDFTLGAQKLSAESARIQAPRGVGIREGVSPPQPTRESGGAPWAPQPPTHFWHIWDSQNTSGRENSLNKAGFSV